MSLILYINGQLADLDAGQVIAQTKQVNDLNSLDDRQASYTNKFRLPKTATNLKIMDYLSVPGNTSNIPYQKNQCSLFSENGECFIYDGWASITDGGDDFEVVLYDGIVDLYKEIENLNLSDVELGQANHEKNVANVKASMVGPYFGYPPYTYILADYNGRTGYTPEAPRVVDIEYLVPSINVKYLWEQIFEKFNMTWGGSVFDTENFKDLWLTFPKGVTTTDNDMELFASDNYLLYNYSPFHTWASFWLRWIEADPNMLQATTGNKHMKVHEAGTYRLEVTGTIQASQPVAVCYGKNAELYAASGDVPVAGGIAVVSNGTGFTKTILLQLNANDSICLFLRKIYSNFRFSGDSAIEVKLTKVTPNTFDFSQALEGLSIRDFLTEVVHRFGLTIFKRKDVKHYDFLTLQEHLQTSHVMDWSAKFCKKVSEKYIYGSYAQRNWLRYNYTNKEDSHSDWYIDVANVNLPDSKDVIKSKIYSPEKDLVTFLGHPSRRYKLWEKEAVEEPEPGQEPFTYKPLDKHYYFIKRQIVVNQPTVTLKSDALAQSVTTGVYNIESFHKLSFADVVQEYYSPLGKLLNKSLIVTAELLLNDHDMANIDFKKLYFIEQLSAYFILNKISNYIPGKPVRCELVRVQADPPEEADDTVQHTITITDYTQVTQQGQETITFTFTSNYATGTLTLERRFAAGGQWHVMATAVSSPVTINVAETTPGAYSFRIHDASNNVSSNTEYVAI